MRSIATLSLFFLVACGGPGDPSISEFSVHDLPADAVAPVSAVSAEDFSLYYAYVSNRDGWPYVMPAEGAAVPFPSEPDERTYTDSVAMAASDDGRFHFLYDAGDQIHYVRMNADGTFDRPSVLDAERSREPTLIATPWGDLVAAWVRDATDSSSSAEVMIAHGRSDYGQIFFGEPSVANAASHANGPVSVTGLALAISPEGPAHVAFGWQAYIESGIELVSQDGSTFTSVEVASFARAPSLSFTADGVAHVSYIAGSGTSVGYAQLRDQEVVPQAPIYTPESDRLMHALMTVDAADVMHVAMADSKGVHYLRRDGENADLQTIIGAAGYARLSPRAGGFYLAPDGEPVIAFQRSVPSESMGCCAFPEEHAHVAVGLPE